MVEGPPIALRCRNTSGRTLAVSRQPARQADDHPPVEPPVSPGGRGGGDQEGRDAARVAPQLRNPPARAFRRNCEGTWSGFGAALRAQAAATLYTRESTDHSCHGSAAFARRPRHAGEAGGVRPAV